MKTIAQHGTKKNMLGFCALDHFIGLKRLACLLILLVCIFPSALEAAVLNATFNTANDVRMTANTNTNFERVTDKASYQKRIARVLMVEN